MLRTAQLLPLTRAFDTALRRRAFPPDAGSLLPGPLAATRTGLAPAGNDELPTESDHVITQPLSTCRAYSRAAWILVEIHGELYAAAPTDSVSGLACRRRALTSWGICL